MQERLLKRGETSGRADDNLETIAKRFDTFMEVSMPVMDHFADKVSSVPAPDEVFVEVCKVFEARGIAPVEAAAEEEEEVEEEEELVPVAELEKDADMVAAATKIQAVHRGRAARKEKKVEEAPAAEEVLEKADPAPAPEHLEAAPVVEEAAAEAAGEAVPPPAVALASVVPPPAEASTAIPVPVAAEAQEAVPAKPPSPASKPKDAELVQSPLQIVAPRERFSDYVSSHGVEKLLRDSMRKLNDARPADPAKYLAKYFSAAT